MKALIGTPSATAIEVPPVMIDSAVPRFSGATTAPASAFALGT
jgi:hypothetical protein